MTSTSITMEEQRAVEGLLNINPKDLQTQQYIPQQVQQIVDYNQMPNVV